MSNEKVTPEILADVRAQIDAAKQQAKLIGENPTRVEIAPGATMLVKRSKPRATKDDDIDPSNVKITGDPAMVGRLVARLNVLRAQVKELQDEDAAIKQILESQIGELEYLGLSDGERPMVSMRFVESVGVNTDAVREKFPAEEYPDLYKKTVSRPLRLL